MKEFGLTSYDDAPEWVPPAPANQAPPLPPQPYGPSRPNSAPTAPQPYGPSGYDPNFYAPPALSSPRRGRKKLLVGGVLVLVLLIAGGAIGGYRMLQKSPALNYQGKKVDQPLAALKQAESSVFNLTQHQIVNRGAGDKCYYAVPATGKSAARWDVSAGIYCGPYAFLDSDAGSSLLHYSVTGKAVGSHVSLTVADNPESTATGPFPVGLQLVRPGSSHRISRFAAVSIPTAPAGPADAFLSIAKIGKGKELLSDITYDNRPAMYGTAGGISLDSLQDVSYYGTGQDARSAATGQRLIAFQFTYSGDTTSTITKLDLGVSVDGAAERKIPQVAETANYKVISVPTTAKSVDIVLKSSGTTQTLSLIDGKRGAHNIQVLTRTHYYQDLNTTENLSMALSQDGDSGSTAMKLTVKGAYLDYFFQRKNGTYAAVNDPTKAWLYIDLDYTVDVDPGHTYHELPSPLMELQDSSGHIVAAKNYADDGGAYIAFLVPANFTSGTLLFGDGPKTFDDGLTETLSTKFQIKLSFDAG